MITYIGIDLGGTNVRAALVDEHGNILHVVKRDSKALEDAESIVNNLIECIQELPNYQSSKGIGLGVPGPVDVKEGWMLMATNIPALTKYPLKNVLETRLSLPVFLDNDANVAGLAEALVGGGKGKDVVYYVTQSTGIGGALIVHGKIVSGRVGHAGEVGNLIVDLHRDHVNHLNVGAIENEASGRAIIRKAQALINPNIQSAYDVFKIKDINPQARQIIETMAIDMGTMFSYIAHIVDPDVFIIGGGVSKSSDLYFETMISSYASKVHPPLANTPFIKAQLDEPGLIGAAMLPKSQGV
jgi:glucokinase